MRSALVAALLFTACGGSGGNPTSNHSPAASTSPSAGASASAAATSSGSLPSPKPINGAYGVLVGSQASSPYTVSVVGGDGKITASAEASAPAQVNCGTSAAAIVPLPVSASNSRIYFMDAAGVIHFLGPAGDTGRATSVPAPTSSRRASFAVSPDDRRIAVVTEDFTSTGATTRLYVEDLGGGNRTTTYSQTGTYGLWPIGWHGTNNLVVAKVPACAQGGGPLCCGPLEFHVVDPLTFTRRFTIGSPTCVVAGAPTPAGVACESVTQQKANIENWTGQYTMGGLTVAAPTPAHVSPNGRRLAVLGDAGQTSIFSLDTGSTTALSLYVCGWIDDTHVMSGGDPQHQPRVAEVVSSAIVPVAATGDCGGRIPGGL